jgi:ABC-2 type transport system ATP-binding protein
VTALDDFTVDIPKGKIGILGPNGAGKSTFVKIALGLIESTSGEITVLGENLDKNSIEIRKKIGYMPEHDCIPNKMTGVEFLIEMGQVSGLDYQTATQRTHEILGHLRMGEEKYRLIEEYSGGMRQKIKLAQGLVHGPELMFLDEPTSGLDPNARQEMLETINGLAEISNTNVLLSTHILQDVETVCDYVIIINNGKLQIKENVKELVKRQTDTIQIRVGENSDEFISILKQNNNKRNIEITDRWIRIPYKNEESFKEIISAAASAKCQLYEMERIAMTMDNIYLEVVN